MDEKPGVATRLIYQLFIALGQKSVSMVDSKSFLNYICFIIPELKI